MPSIGRIERIRFPQGPGVRNDAGVYRGFTIPVFYDSLMSKLVVWGQDREQARRRMLRALDESVLEGPRTNIAFHRWLLSHPEFIAGNLSTRFLEQHFTPELLAPSRDESELALLAAALHAREEHERVNVADDHNGQRSAWRSTPPPTLRPR
jgi:acetyl/propionyl-CoA carboxylase alpha subunit